MLEDLNRIFYQEILMLQIMRKSLESKIESSISDCRTYNFDFYYKNKGIKEPRFVKCSINFPIWYPVEVNKERIYDYILENFTMNDTEVSISYVKHSIPKYSENETAINFCLRDFEYNICWNDNNFYQQKWKPPKVKFSKRVTKEHQVILEKMTLKEIFIFCDDIGEIPYLLRIKPEFMWPTIYKKHNSAGYNEILELIFIFIIRSYKCIYEIYSSKYSHASGQVLWYRMGRSEDLQIRFIPERLDNKNLESYQLESTYEKYEDKHKYEDSDEHDYDRDTFDELTDGQYGSYDDWLEGGKDLDDLNDWLGR